jgi:WD40 repeat protein
MAASAPAGFLVSDTPAPPELELPEVPLTLDFHPSANVLAVGLVDGSLRVGRYAASGHEAPFLVAAPFRAGAGGCRAVRFSTDGDLLFAGSADHSIVALTPAGAVAWRVADAHRDPVSCLHVAAGAHSLASGDDSGAVKLWDLRAPPAKPALQFDVFQDYVAEITSDPEHHPECLLACSGDGSLACFDLRAPGKVLGKSNDLEEDLLSMTVIKGGRKVVCGTSEGTLLIFSWGNWDGPSDSLPGHPESVGSLLKLDESTVLSGSSDGLIRVVGVQPSKLYGLVGDHGGFPIERMAWSHDRCLIGSVSHDSSVRFWDAAYLHEQDDAEDDAEEDAGGEAAASEGADRTNPELLAALRARAAATAAGGDEDSDSNADDEDGWEDEDDGGGDDGNGKGSMSDSDDSDDSGNGNGGGGGGGGGSRGAAQYKTPAQSFFQDL